MFLQLVCELLGAKFQKKKKTEKNDNDHFSFCFGFAIFYFILFIISMCSFFIYKIFVGTNAIDCFAQFGF